ncbi:WD40-repeat-containing domain protein [Tirmania nivea]|nr:WD40-repeat-containing domain protein [Tirmania nivea]
MPQIFNPVLSNNLSTPQGTYIYEFAPQGPSNLAAISSTDSLHIFNASTIQLLSTIPSTHTDGVTCLEALDTNVLVTAGRDGQVKLWDARSGKQSGKLASCGKPFLSLAVDKAYNAIAAGEELVDQLASVVIWDLRNFAVSRHYTESHSDDITELQFDRVNLSLLLSGSTDGLVNVYDLKQTKRDIRDADDDEALFQVINHGSSVHRTGFLRSTAPRVEDMDIYALSHDEILTVYPLNDPSTVDDDTPPTAEGDESEGKSIWGDVRQKLGCDYVITLLPETAGRGGTLVVGSHQQQWIDLMPFENNWSGRTKHGRMSGWRIDAERKMRLAGGHGEEVARCVYVVQETRTVYTGGEDGLVKVWKGPEPEAVLEEPEKLEKPKVERKRGETKHSRKRCQPDYRKSRSKPY